LIGKALGAILYFIYSFVNNYAMSIILFTILVKLILLPLTLNQLRQTQKMAELQPKLKEIQEKYKNDKEKLAAKQMELYQKENINPFGGCLPILIQLPILFGLFSVLREPQKYVFVNNPELLEKAIHAPFLWLPNLVDPDPIILPILAALTTYLSMKNTGTNMEQPQSVKTMNTIMPLLILWWGRSFPAGLTLYWVISNLFQMAQQYFLPKISKLKEESN